LCCPNQQPASSGACHICGSKDHWANTCPNKGATPFGGAPAGGPRGVAKHGLDDATNLKVIALIKEQEKVLLPTCLSIAALYEVDSKATDKYDISLDGKVIAKYCLHCGRYTKGKTAHSSAEHTGRLFTPRPGGAAPSPAPAPSAAAVIASFPIGAPVLEGAVQLPRIPVVPGRWGLVPRPPVMKNVD
jgi:hypothetical protein